MRLAVFDLDGTITRHDTLVPYIALCLRPQPWRWVRLPTALPSLAAYALRSIDRGALKGALIRATLGGLSRGEIARCTDQFVPDLLESGLFAEAVAKITEHRNAGDRLVLMSASTDLYVPAVGRALGFDEVICTGVRWNGDRLRGDLATPNRRAEEKARCFATLRERFPNRTTFAYGNASSDLDHLRLAEHGVLVNGCAAARQRATKLGVSTVEWR
jgi:phosphatidylglycerophosphatase C